MEYNSNKNDIDLREFGIIAVISFIVYIFSTELNYFRRSHDNICISVHQIIVE